MSNLCAGGGGSCRVVLLDAATMTKQTTNHHLLATDTRWRPALQMTQAIQGTLPIL